MDCGFLRMVSNDVSNFRNSTRGITDCRRVLLFPPLSSRHRFLIHKYVQDLDDDEEEGVSGDGRLCTFSIGQDDRRRTVVCLRDTVANKSHPISVRSVMDQCDNPNDVATIERLVSNSNNRVRANPRRPDKPLYVPKAKRSTSDTSGHGNGGDQTEDCSNASTIESDQTRTCVQELEIGATPLVIIENGFLLSSDNENHTIKSVEEAPSFSDRMTEEGPSIEEFVNRSNGDSYSDDWDALYDDSGECLDDATLKQLTDAVGKVSIDSPSIDYWSAIDNEKTKLVDDELGHVVEIYDFPADFKTNDLVMVFFQFKQLGFDIKWVDDTHALGVFSSRTAAQQALAMKYPSVKCRPLSQAIKESRKKALKCAEFMQPYKPRPETSAILARRLVAGALGLQMQVSREQRDEERRKIREAKDRRRQAVKQKEAAWEGLLADDNDEDPS